MTKLAGVSAGGVYNDGAVLTDPVVHSLVGIMVDGSGSGSDDCAIRALLLLSKPRQKDRIDRETDSLYGRRCLFFHGVVAEL
jgi:hypothetical protein